MIHCKPTGKVYVGQTISLEGRKLAHLGELKRGVHRNVYLQRAYNKYGEESFYWEFVECAVKDLAEMEQYFIDNIPAQSRFNMDPYVRKTPAGINRSEETKLKTSLSKLGIPNPLNAGELNGSKKPEVRRVLADKKKKLTDEQCLQVFMEYVPYKITNRGLAERYGCTERSIKTARAYAQKYLINTAQQYQA